MDANGQEMGKNASGGGEPRKGSGKRSAINIGRAVLKQEAKGLQTLSEKIDSSFAAAVDLLDDRETIIFTGVGKSGHIGKKLTATFNSFGVRSVFLHPTEAAHGDMGFVGPNDAIVAISRSGKAIEMIPLLAGNRHIPIILISENDHESLAGFADTVIRLPKVAEAWGHAPTTSTVMQMAIGDALAVALAIRNGFTEDDFKITHPGGVLGHGKG